MNKLPPPAIEPISLAEARLQCKVDPEGSPPTHPDDDLLSLFISAAREWAEEYTGTAIGARVQELALTIFPGTGNQSTTAATGTATLAAKASAITLPEWPVLGIASIAYINAAGSELLVPPADYLLDTSATPRRIILADGAAWPSAKDVVNGFRVRYVIGYSAPGESPQDSPLPRAIKVALLLMLAHLYRNREASSVVALQTIPLGATALLDTQRIRLGFA